MPGSQKAKHKVGIFFHTFMVFEDRDNAVAHRHTALLLFLKIADKSIDVTCGATHEDFFSIPFKSVILAITSDQSQKLVVCL